MSYKQRWAISGQALWVPGGWGSLISRQSAHAGGRVVSPAQHLPSGDIPETNPRATVRLEGIRQWHHREMNPLPSGLWCSASNPCATANTLVGKMLTVVLATMNLIQNTHTHTHIYIYIYIYNSFYTLANTCGCRSCQCNVQIKQRSFPLASQSLDINTHLGLNT